MKILVIGDIHNQWESAEKLIHAVEHDKVILTGDYFDNFYDTSEIVKNTAIWLKESLTKTNRVHLVGNHDYHYMPHVVNSYTSICGHTPDKDEAINQILSVDDWNNLKYFHVDQGWWFSHAGITKTWFEDPFKGFTEESIQSKIDQALSSGLDPICLTAVDHARGGRCAKGGMLWNDWDNTDVIEGVKQIVGHTPGRKVRYNAEANSYCVDAMPYEYITITDGTVKVHTYKSRYDVFLDKKVQKQSKGSFLR
jgi:hypothetical protein